MYFFISLYNFVCISSDALYKSIRVEGFILLYFILVVCPYHVALLHYHQVSLY